VIPKRSRMGKSGSFFLPPTIFLKSFCRSWYTLYRGGMPGYVSPLFHDFRLGSIAVHRDFALGWIVFEEFGDKEVLKRISKRKFASSIEGF
jgi:hypothetical protein